MDKHKLWRRVRANYMQWEQDAPEGCEPHVLVYLAGREEPVEIGQVATHKDEPDYP